MNKAQRNLCPFCFHKSDEWDDNWRCPHCQEIVKRDQYGKLPSKCPNCEKAVLHWEVIHACPYCKSIVPKELDECDEILPIAVVGPTRSGKTHFMTVMAHNLLIGGIFGDYWSVVRIIRHEIVTSNGVRITKQADEYLEFDEKLYNLNNHETLQSTQKDSKVCSLLIELTYKEGMANLFKEPWKKKRILLAFSDTAGEGFNKTENMDKILERYPIFKNHAKAVIAMVDPLELYRLSQEADACEMDYISYGILPEDKSRPKTTAREVMDFSFIKKQMKYQPVAWCMTKTEALLNLKRIPERSVLATSLGGLTGYNGNDWAVKSKTSGKVNIKELAEMSEQTKIFIKNENDGKDYIDDDTFIYQCYFAVDALGESYHDGRRHGLPRPRRILDPLLWILWQYGLCGGR